MLPGVTFRFSAADMLLAARNLLVGDFFESCGSKDASILMSLSDTPTSDYFRSPTFDAMVSSLVVSE